MFKKLKKFVSENEEITKIQNHAEECIDQILPKEIINGRLIKDVEFTLGSTLKLEHKLNRVPLGWMVVQSQDGYNISFQKVSVDSKFINLKPQVFTNWISYTPTLTDIAADVVNFKYRHDGDSIDVKGYFKTNLAVTGIAYITIPTTLAMDYTKMPHTHTKIGTALAWDSAPGTGYGGGIMTNNSSPTEFYIEGDEAHAQWAAAVPFGWAIADDLKIQCDSIPIKGLTLKANIWVF